MDLIADILLMAGSFGAAIYCYVLSARLKKFTTLETGMGGAIAVLSAQVDDMTVALEKARQAANGSAESLEALTARGESVARKLELLVASLHDLPDPKAPPKPAVEEVPDEERRLLHDADQQFAEGRTSEFPEQRVLAVHQSDVIHLADGRGEMVVPHERQALSERVGREQHPVQPPATLLAFCRHYVRGIEPYLLLMSALTAVLAISEAMLYGILGQVVDWLAEHTSTQ